MAIRVDFYYINPTGDLDKVLIICPTIPRIGETVILNDIEYKVKDVIYEYNGNRPVVINLE